MLGGVTMKMKTNEDKRFTIGAIMLAVFVILLRAVKWLCAHGWWPLVMAYASVMVCLIALSVDMTPMEEDNGIKKNK